MCANAWIALALWAFAIFMVVFGFHQLNKENKRKEENYWRMREARARGLATYNHRFLDGGTQALKVRR